jgi:tRNA-2-methylthio-N6-dimethylallyladenosine synthase
MNRHYTSEDYLKKVKKLREICPDVSITSDIIVGFPGESDDDFQKTIDLMEKVRFDSTFSFKFSFREGTSVAKLNGNIGESIKSKRLSILQSLQEKHSIEINKNLEGSVANILVEGLSKNDQADIMGRTSTNKIVNFTGDIGTIGKIVPVKIIKAYTHSLRGKVI